MNVSRRVLVTGGSGFFGAAIVRATQKAGYEVVSIDRQLNTLHEGVRIVVADIANLPVLKNAFKGAFAVIHAAGLAHVFGPDAKRADLFEAINERGSDTVMDAALSAGVQKIVLVSSVSVYGQYGGTCCDETQLCSPRGAYALSKWRAELRSTHRVGSGPASLSILRFATIYGEGDRGNIARLILALKRGRFIWPGAGLNSKSLIYKDDAAQACVLALEDLRPGVNIFNVSTSVATMQEIVRSICDALGRPVPQLRIPENLVRLLLATCRRANRAGQITSALEKFIHDDVYSAKKYQEAFGFQPSVSLSEGIQREVADLYTRADRDVRRGRNEHSNRTEKIS